MIRSPHTPEHLLLNGVKRNPGYWREPKREGVVLNLGSGNAPMSGPATLNLDRPGWEAPLLPYRDATVAAVHMYHFIEHLDPDIAMMQLREVGRVLEPGGLAYICVPHAMCPLAYQAPDHKSFWTEEGLQDTFYSAGYDSTYGNDYDMDIVWMQVAGVSWSNLCVLAQLAKRIDGKPYETPWRREP